jgi:butyrate kinase
MCFSGRYTETGILDLLTRQGGMVSYFGTDDIRRVEAAIAAGSKPAELVYRALVYQVAKEIGAYTVACEGRPDAVILTGGLTLSKRFLTDLKQRISPLGLKVFVYPGEEEMSALALRVLGVLCGKEKERSYDKEVAVRG